MSHPSFCFLIVVMMVMFLYRAARGWNYSTREDNGTKVSKGASLPPFLPLSFLFVIRVAPF